MAVCEIEQRTSALKRPPCFWRRAILRVCCDTAHGQARLREVRWHFQFDAVTVNHFIRHRFFQCLSYRFQRIGVAVLGMIQLDSHPVRLRLNGA